MSRLEKYFEANRKMWDEFAKVHIDSEPYGTKNFLEGQTTLKSIELEELGDVQGRTLLHLQCHFGLDTLSWAREGAKVTGVDFSREAIRLARELTDKTNLDARFIQSNIYDLLNVLDEKFDIVFTSYGVHCWLPDLNRWADIVSHFLKPGGIFYIAEFHPFMWVFDNENPDNFVLKYTYFHSPEPYEWDVNCSYAGPDAKIEPCVDYEWAHGMGDVINAIIQAGLQIQFVHEFPKSCFQQFPFFVKKDDGYWYYDNPKIQLPLMYSIKAIKT
jgi:SAM-dependent methyltransferase